MSAETLSALRLAQEAVMTLRLPHRRRSVTRDATGDAATTWTGLPDLAARVAPRRRELGDEGGAMQQVGDLMLSAPAGSDVRAGVDQVSVDDEWYEVLHVEPAHSLTTALRAWLRRVGSAL